MAIPFEHYSRIKNRYCIAYFGSCEDYFVLLRYLRPCLSKAYPDLDIQLAVPSEYRCHLGDETHLTSEELQERKTEFGHIYQVKTDFQQHSVLRLLEEAGVWPRFKAQPCNKHCYIAPSGVAPTGSLAPEQHKQLERAIRQRGLQPCDSEESAGWIAGVESATLYRGGFTGKGTILVPTGLGENLYRRLFPDGAVLPL